MNKVTNKNWLIYVLPMLGFVATGQGALQFTNVTGILTTNSSTLNAVEYDGNDTFVAVGENSTTLSARFVSSLPWVSNGVPGAPLSLKSVAYGANRFVAGGANALTFTTTNASTWTQTSDPDAFGIAVSVQGLAFNGSANRFAAVASFVNISYADNAVTSWIPATINNSVLIESFRGVTTLPGNGFAACGLRGDLRVSPDGGATWNVSRPFSGGEPDLFGIAAGGGRVISVGNFGRIMVSGDGGNNWTNNAAPIGNTNNAVAFTGEEFIVVGNGGRILTGTNANASDWVTNATLGGNLRGVIFATTGKLQGVAAIVGDGGTVILGGTRPLAAVNPINQTNCEGVISLPLSVSIAPGPNNPSEAQTVDWYSAPTGGVLLLAGSTNFTFTNPLPANPSVPSNYLYYAEQRDLRTGFVSTNRTEVILTINPTPTVDVVTDQGPYCNTNGGLAISFSGPVAGTTFAWTSTVNVGFGTGGAGNIGAFTAINGGVAPVAATVTVTPTANGCVGTPSIFTVTVNPTPTVNPVANQGPYCNTNAGLAISFSGPVAGTTFAWTSTVNVGFGTSGAGNIGAFTAINASTAPVVATVTVTPTANGCPGTPSIFTVAVNPTPTVNPVANQGPYCNTNAGLAISFSGPVAGTTFAWTSTVNVGFGTGGAGNIFAFIATNGGTVPVVATVTVTPTANGCPGTPSTFTVTVNPTPTVNPVANQGPYCNTNAGLGISFSGPVAGTTFAWTSTVNVGFGTSGAGNISAFTATNGGTAPVVATVTVTPTANGCPGTPRAFTVTVNPTPTVNPVASQGPYCNTNGGLAINFSGPVAGTTFAWASTVDVGFGTSGAGNIGAFTAISGNPTSNVPVVATVTVTPTANGCPGTPRAFTVTVNPTPTVNPVANQGPYCNTNAGLAISFSGPVAGTTFAWTSTVNVGFGTSGAGNISAFIATNGGTVAVVATVTVTPTANGCPGTPSTFTVTVNPTPTVTSIANQTQTLSVGQVTSPVTLNGIATSFIWTNNNTSIGLGASGTLPAVGGMAVFSAFTATNSGTATITVTPRYLNVIDCVTAATTNFVITVVNPVEPSLKIQMLNSTNVVLEWVAHTNTALLSATNLTPVVFWSTNGVYGAGTNRVTNSILFEPPSQFFRLTNAP